jgi:predicted nucleic-acid-binding protein
VIGLDTNFVVRYPAQGDAVQAAMAMAFIEQRPTELNPGFISLVAITEVAWVLGRSYRMDGRGARRRSNVCSRRTGWWERTNREGVWLGRI